MLAMIDQVLAHSASLLVLGSPPLSCTFQKIVTVSPRVAYNDQDGCKSSASRLHFIFV